MDLYRSFVRRVALPACARVYNRSFWPLYRTWERSQYWPRQRLDDYRFERLRSLLDHALGTVPFYRDWARAHGIGIDRFRSFDDLRLLPALGKDDYRNQGIERFVSETEASDARRDSTSGTTGSPFFFFNDRLIEAAKMARLLRENRWAGWEPGTRYLRIWGPHDETVAKRLFYDRLMRREQFNAFHVESDFDHLVAAFRRLRPRIVEAYASAVVQFARLCRERGVSLPAPQSVIVSAEGISDGHRRLVEEALGARVYNRYGSREVGNIAHECGSGGFHVNAESFVLEEEDHPDIPGATALLITCLDNRAMPFLRYRIGDLGSLAAGECACGRSLPLLGAITGRATDFFVLPSGEQISFLYFNHFFEQYGGVVDVYQVEQTAPGELSVRIVPGPRFEPAAAVQVERRLSDEWRDRVGMRLQVLETLEREPTGKLRVYKPLRS